MAQTCSSCKTTESPTWVTVCKGKAPANGGLPGPDTLRCADCNDARSRLERLWKRAPDLKAQYTQEALTPDERKAFITEAKGLMGDQLETLVKQTISKKRISEKESSLSAECEWLDEKDLKERLKSRPDKVDKIMECGQQMHCPVMGCTM